MCLLHSVLAMILVTLKASQCHEQVTATVHEFMMLIQHAKKTHLIRDMKSVNGVLAMLFW